MCDSQLPQQAYSTQLVYNHSDMSAWSATMNAEWQWSDSSSSDVLDLTVTGNDTFNFTLGVVEAEPFGVRLEREMLAVEAWRSR
jgi:hypothetical protein